MKENLLLFNYPLLKVAALRPRLLYWRGLSVQDGYHVGRIRTAMYPIGDHVTCIPRGTIKANRIPDRQNGKILLK